MISLHLKKNLKLKYLIILTFILLIPVAFSYYETSLYYQEMVTQYQSKDSSLNLQTLKEIIDGESGLSYFFNFIFIDGPIIIFCLLFTTASNLFIGSSIVDDLSKGSGNLIISRISFKKYLRDNVKAQIVFNFIYLFIFFTTLFFLSYLLLGKLDLEYVHANYSMPVKKGTLFNYLGIAYLQILNISVVTTAITILSSQMVAVIKNKYIIRIFPLLYYFITLMLANMVGNINSIFASILTTLIMDVQVLWMVSEIFTNYSPNPTFIWAPINFIFVMIFILACTILGRINNLKYGRDYLL